jgi:hypothetical protein
MLAQEWDLHIPFTHGLPWASGPLSAKPGGATYSAGGLSVIRE